ncbi:GroES-like protein [Suhomyces tanzawaensis NRRL Y-17324]|uniref:GroES-like protein n=1 Tax=Suhomyces tanzawaensis NRRL Y-17324 TaxID=984487 RepID=A0A1E4SQX1_9ASCO|nr:GroES-like protein [Suhomyces tanzawaensis NRRL Y-17324]ODV81913.1 GroES-like protein [Suhomyces tanzawaensis NRRL Y-17324]
MSVSAVPQYFKGFAVSSSENWNKPKLVEYERKQIQPHDVVIKNVACGLCGSDLHTLREQWMPMQRKELVVGHEIVGHVMAVGDKVTQFKVGQRVGVGAASASCKDCVRCKNNNEHYCKKQVLTYNSHDEKTGYVTQGGYSSHSIADEDFVFPIPDKMDFTVAGPLMCAGLTVFSPLIRNLGEDATGKTVGIIGIGGLGHLAIQFANALGAKVVTFSRSSSKKEQALSMGADSFVATGEEEGWNTKYEDSFDLMLNCASGVDGLNLSDYLDVLKVDANFVSVGLPPAKDSFQLSPISFLGNGGSFGSSFLGSKKEAMKMLEIAAEKGVKPWIEEIDISEENCHEALTRCHNGDVRYRFVFTGFDKAFGN